MLATSVRGSALNKSHDIQSVKILDKMLTLPNQQLNVTEPIFLWMMTSSTEETYQNPFNLSLLEYLINRMNYNNGLKEFMIEDGRQYVCILKLNLRKFFGKKLGDNIFCLAEKNHFCVRSLTKLLRLTAG